MANKWKMMTKTGYNCRLVLFLSATLHWPVTSYLIYYRSSFTGFPTYLCYKLLLWELLHLFSCTVNNNELVAKRINRKASEVFDFQKVWTFFKSEDFTFFLVIWFCRWQSKKKIPFSGCNIPACIKSREI